MKPQQVENLDRVVQKYLKAESTLCYYPSSGFWDENIFKLPFDVILLSDYIDNNRDRKNRVNSNEKEILTNLNRLTKGRHFIIEKKIDKNESYIVFQYNNRIYIFYFEDNRNVRNRLIEQEIQLDAFIIHNDGCMEGGNYECVTNRDWMLEIEKTFKEDTVIVKDHSSRNYHSIQIETYRGHERRGISKDLEKIFSGKIR